MAHLVFAGLFCLTKMFHRYKFYLCHVLFPHLLGHAVSISFVCLTLLHISFFIFIVLGVLVIFSWKMFAFFRIATLVFMLNLFKLLIIIMDNITKFWNWLKTLPFWLRAVVLFLVGLLALVFTTSCSTMSRVIVKETSSGVTITTTQSADQQNSTSIEVSPTLNFTRNVPEN